MCCWLFVQVNGQLTPDLDTFLSVVSPLKDGDFARVKVCHLETTQQKVRCCVNRTAGGAKCIGEPSGGELWREPHYQIMRPAHLLRACFS